MSKAESQGLAVKPVGTPLNQVPAYFIFPKDEQGKELRSRIDAALKKLKENGDLKALSNQWFKADYTEMR